MKHPVGHPAEPVREAWAMRFGIKGKFQRLLTSAMCWQLCRCRDDSARRLLLGVSQWEFNFMGILRARDK